MTAYVLLGIAAVLAGTGRRKEAVAVDAGVVVGMVGGAVAAGAGMGLMLGLGRRGRRERRGGGGCRGAGTGWGGVAVMTVVAVVGVGIVVGEVLVGVMVWGRV